MDFDETRLYYSHQQLQQKEPHAQDGEEDDAEVDDLPAVTGEEDTQVDAGAVRRHFREFLRNYRLGPHQYFYRERLLRMHRRLNNNNNKSNMNTAKLRVDLAHVGEYDVALLGFIMNQPAQILPSLELAASDALDSFLHDTQMRRSTAAGGNDNNSNEGGGNNNENNSGNTDDGGTTDPEDRDPAEVTRSIQVLLEGNLKSTPLRNIKSEHMNKLIKCPGIVISTTPVKSRAVQLALQCPTCLDRKILHECGGPFQGIPMPMVCPGSTEKKCSKYPYSVLPDDSLFLDQQTLKLQESPETVPTGEMPRSVVLVVERSLVDIAPPGTRISVLCIPTIVQSQSDIKSIYLRVVGISKDQYKIDGGATNYTPAEEEAFRALARRSDVYEILSRSIAPSIKGQYTVDIKSALLCMLLGGSRKRLPDGVRLRGDINVLLLGDPSTAKSQFLKFISKVAPIGIYTSGKGSSAAGLTASIIRDSKGEFYLEGGAMVLADGGVVSIDEFDKMRPSDRVAIHEAMEQQTISVAKAGITTVLNSRCSVLAAANPVFGRYDDLKSTSENIDLMSTILSRFDLIFLVRDIREEQRDYMICQHVMGVHMGGSSSGGGNNHNKNNPFGSAGIGGGAGGGGAGLEFLNSGLDLDDNQGETNSTTNLSPEAIADNVMRVATTGNGELHISSMKKYIQYCKAKCSPRLSEEADEILVSSYVKIRDDVRRLSIQTSGESSNATIPITVRQLEALVRLSESLAKLRLDTEVRSDDVSEALRLFRVSTMAANSADQQQQANPQQRQAPDNANNPNQNSQYQELLRTEEFLKSRLNIGGSMVSKQKLIEEMVGQGYNAICVARSISIMVQRGEILERNQGRLIKRLK